MSLPTALYLPDADTFVPTALCIGPWHPSHQHGGPPAGLLTDAMARFGKDAADFELLRVQMNLLRPVPMAPLRVEVEPTRLGGQAQWLSARLLALDGSLLGLAHGLRIRRKELQLPPAHSDPQPALAPAESAPELPFDFFPAKVAFHRAVDVRIVEGTWPVGPIGAWIRLRVPLVQGCTSASIARVVTVCDAINGVSPALPGSGFAFPNADLSVRLLRAVAGPWVGMRARSYADSAGAGLVQATLFDQRGELGLASETLVISARS